MDGTVDFSIISSGVTIEEGASVKYSIIMPGSTIKKGAVVEYAIIGEDCIITDGCSHRHEARIVSNRDDGALPY